MSTSEAEELHEVLGELAQMWRELIMTGIAIALFVFFIVFCVKYIRYRHGWAKRENQKFGKRALRVTGDLINVEGKSHSVRVGIKDDNGDDIYKYEQYTVVTYDYCVGGKSILVRRWLSIHW